MAHSRDRFIQIDFRKALKFSPLVGLLGHRQVGKTTFTSKACENYLTLDKKELLAEAQENPEALIKAHSKKLTTIDECQLAPELFPALKEWVRTHKQPGQFILTGSVRFSSKRAIRESLTGRILNLELLPMTISEIQHKPLPNSLIRLLHTENLRSFVEVSSPELTLTRKLQGEIDLYLERGGLPGICFIRDNHIRRKSIEDLIHLTLDRDLRQIHETHLSLDELKNFLSFLAEAEGTPINYSAIERSVKISDVTQKKLLYALESIFTLRQVHIDGGISSKTYYFEDQAEYNFFKKTKDPQKSIEGLVGRHLRAQFQYGLQEPFSISQYLSRNKSRVPFVVQQKGNSLGIIPILTETPSLMQKQAGNSFLRWALKGKVLFLSREIKEFKVLSDKALVAPMHWIV